MPGKSMFNLKLGANYADVVGLLQDCKISESVIQFDNSDPMRVDFSLDKEVIRFRKMNDENYAWQSDLALLCFKDGNLKSIATYSNGSCGYRGLIFEKIGLNDEIRDLKEYFALEYDNVDEVFYALHSDKINGLAIYGSSCDLSIDPAQKINAVKVFFAD